MKRIFTIGHSNYGIDRFYSMLQEHEIRFLADIRSTPYSRYSPQYNQEKLKRSLELVSIEYVFLGDELGGRIKDPACYIIGRIPEKKAGYAAHLNYEVICTREWFLSGIRRLVELADNGHCVIMCSEENPEQCHRELIVGRKLRELGYSVTHIRAQKSGAG